MTPREGPVKGPSGIPALVFPFMSIAFTDKAVIEPAAKPIMGK